MEPTAPAKPRRRTGDRDLWSNPKNQLVLEHVLHARRPCPATPISLEAPDYWTLGGHPDIAERMVELGLALAAGSAIMAGGRITLIHRPSLTVIAALSGTGYFLRLTDADFDQALAQESTTVKKWNTGTTDLATAAGPNWIVGAWKDTEPRWLQATQKSLDSR